VEHFLDPSTLVPETAMPAYGFTEDEAKALTLLIMSRRTPPVSKLPLQRR